METQALQELQQGAYGKGGEVLEWPLYDTLKLDPTVITNTMFADRYNGPSGKTLADTNMALGGQMPNGQHMTAHCIKVAMYLTKKGGTVLGNAELYDLADLLTTTTVEVVVENKAPQWQGTLGELMGISMAGVAVPTNAGDNLVVGMLSDRHHGIYPLNVPIILPGTVPFGVRVTYQNVAGWVANDKLTGSKLRFTFAGKLRRLTS